MLGILHTHSALVDVVIGCYSLKTLEVKPIAVPTHPAFEFYDGPSATISMFFSSQIVGQSGTIDLTTMVQIYSEVPECGAFKLFAFTDAGHSAPTTAANELALVTNPTDADPSSGILTPLVSFSFGADPVFPSMIYLRAETNGLGSSVVSKSFKLKIGACSG